MKSNYMRAEAQVIFLPSEDVIRTSGDPIIPTTPTSFCFGRGDNGRSDGLQDIVG